MALVLLYNNYNKYKTEEEVKVLIKIDFESEKPIYNQVLEAIIIGIARGDLLPGEKLPSVRDLAEDIGINLHTVNKSYKILKDKGYLSIDRRTGALVRENFTKDKEEFFEEIEDQLIYLLADAKNRGIKKEEIYEKLEDLSESIGGI